MSEIDIVAQFISSVGFPIFVAVYTLFRLEKTIKENTKAINDLRVSLAKEKEED